MGLWKKVYSTELAHRAEIVREMLGVEEIPAIVVNKRDSSLNNFGLYEVHVRTDDVLTSLRIIDEIKFE